LKKSLYLSIRYNNKMISFCQKRGYAMNAKLRFLGGVMGMTLFLATTLLSNTSSDKGISFGLNGGYLNFLGESQSAKPGLLGEASLALPVAKNFSVNLTGGFGQQIFNPFATDFTTQLLTLDFFGQYNIPLCSAFFPIFYTGLSAINFNRGDWPSYWDGAAIAGGGIDLRLDSRVGIRLVADYRYTTGKDFDGISTGSPDTYMTAKAGIYFVFLKPEKPEPAENSGLLASEVFDSILKNSSKKLEQKIQASENNSTSPETVPGKSGNVGPKTNKKINELNKLLGIKEEMLKKLSSELVIKDQQMVLLEKELIALKKNRESGGVNNYKMDYLIAVQKFYDKDSKSADRLFNELLTLDPSHRLAGNCQYWIGECAFSFRDYDSAIDAFEKTLAYPDSPKMDDALIMLGMSHKKLAKVDKADFYFAKILKEHTNSEYAPNAKKYMSKANP
jgi:TolA-binding protein